MGRALSFGLALGIVAMAAAAAADDTKTPAPAKGPITVATVILHGRVMKPNASITVNRVPLDASVRELKQPLVERISKSADKPPF